MDTNTMMLIALALILIFAAVGIWLVNRGSGVESVHTEEDEVVDDTEPVETREGTR